ncbi:MAG: DUF3179 domain-containing protein [Thermocrispum sp.]
MAIWTPLLRWSSPADLARTASRRSTPPSSSRRNARGSCPTTSPVFGPGAPRGGPQLVLVWHEIVNDTVGGQPVSITYCPLTGTAIGFTGVPGRALSFGTTGNLVNSNLLMYVRESDSEWPQILGRAISGDLKGRTLRTVPLLWTTWRTDHPDTQVLSTDTGALRDYGTDPYGSYPNRSGYYAGGEPTFPVQHDNDRFGPKEVVVGVRHGDQQLAIVKRSVRERGVIDTEVGGTPVRARWDPALGTARVTRTDSADPADFLDAMWFAWPVTEQDPQGSGTARASRGSLRRRRHRRLRRASRTRGVTGWSGTAHTPARAVGGPGVVPPAMSLRDQRTARRSAALMRSTANVSPTSTSSTVNAPP